MHLDPAAYHEPTRPASQFRPVRVLAIILGALLIVTVVVGAPVAASGYRMATEAVRGRDALLLAQRQAVAFDFEAAAESLREAQTRLRSAQRFGIPLAPLTMLPVVGTQIRDARTLITASLETAEAFESVATLGTGILRILVESGGLSATAPTLIEGEIAFFRLPLAERRAVLAQLNLAPETLREAADKIESALARFATLEETEFTLPVLTALAPAIDDLRGFAASFRDAARLAELLPPLAGYPEPRRYLILLQNNTEMRPTGGFIGTLGTVTVRDAEAVDLKAFDVYAIDGRAEATLATTPPAPLARYLAATKWFLRDANWSPDFPTAARKAVELWRQEGAEGEFDGVIAIDPTVGEDLLRIVGNVRVGGSLFTPQNVTDEIEYQVEKGFDEKGLPVSQRKDILVALVDEVFRRVVALPSTDWQRAVDAFARALEEKHLMIASFDPVVAAAARAHNWDGAVRFASGDRLMVVDANLAALKTDSVVERSVSYAIVPDRGGLLATVRLRYVNRGSFTWKTTRYRTYTRVFVPAGSELVGVTGAMMNDRILDPARRPGMADIVDELGARSFGAFLSVEPGETRELVFTYRLPPAVVSSVREGDYTLLVQKQPGLIAVPLTLSLDFGKNLKSATPSEEPVQFGDSKYRIQTDLRTDREFGVSF